MPRDFNLVICDGPPGTTRGGRTGMLPIMRKQLAPHCRIFVDDVNRPDESAMLKRWAEQEGRQCNTYGKEKPYGVLQLA